MSSRNGAPTRLGDFTTDRRVVLLAVLSVVIGGASACLAWILLRLIAFFTNLAYFGRWSTATAAG